MGNEVATGGRFRAHRMWVMQLARQDVALPAARARPQPLPSLRSVQGLRLALFPQETNRA
ncbi:hypothetical protein AUC31_17670 [Planococcus rifietoensis]|uniref:Uncharacterized protein n=1 Tax=Planococcus rifietoensis TaxID=200991 RepID=A0A0X9YMN3_9BACL|nr:hypothetical protein AUC31_17670 [Planococcus rifietoensis]